MKTVGVTDYTNLISLKCCGRTDRQTDGRSGPTTRPAFAKVTQVKRFFLLPLNLRERYKVRSAVQSFLQQAQHYDISILNSILLCFHIDFLAITRSGVHLITSSGVHLETINFGANV